MSYHILIYSEVRKNKFIKNLLNALITSTKDGKGNKKWNNNELKMKKDKKHQTSQETDINSKNTSITKEFTQNQGALRLGEIVWNKRKCRWNIDHFIWSTSLQ